jgi:hypothetical protein
MSCKNQQEQGICVHKTQIEWLNKTLQDVNNQLNISFNKYEALKIEHETLKNEYYNAHNLNKRYLAEGNALQFKYNALQQELDTIKLQVNMHVLDQLRCERDQVCKYILLNFL